jgi:hypothetical protein
MRCGTRDGARLFIALPPYGSPARLCSGVSYAANFAAAWSLPRRLTVPELPRLTVPEHSGARHLVCCMWLGMALVGPAVAAVLVALCLWQYISCARRSSKCQLRELSLLLPELTAEAQLYCALRCGARIALVMDQRCEVVHRPLSPYTISPARSGSQLVCTAVAHVAGRNQ